MNTSVLTNDEHYRLLVENITDYAIITLDTEGNITSWNVGAQSLLQYTPEETLGLHSSIFFTENDIAQGAYEKEMSNAKTLGRGEDERWHVRKDGTTFWGSGILFPIRDGNLLIGFAKIFRDRTERMAHEKRKDDFVGIAGHELRTPLSIIKMGIELLIMKTDKPDPAIAHELRSMDEHVDRLAHIITDLLDLSNISAGKLTLNKKRLNLTELMTTEMLPHYQTLFKNHTIFFDSPNNVEVQADKDHLIQVLYNLLSNAVKYSPHADSVEVVVVDSEKFITVTVKDFGVGIPKEERERIFQRFYRVNNKHQNVSGMGVGLYISQEIIKAHGGTMGVLDSNGPGTSMYFTLPAT